MLTAGVDLAAQPPKTGLVIVDWSTARPRIIEAAVGVRDPRILEACQRVAGAAGKVGIDCPLGWPRPFVHFISAHAANESLPVSGEDTEPLRLRRTDVVLKQRRLGLNPLSVSTNMLGVT